MKCEKVIEFKCPNRHLQKRKCHQSQPQTCRVCEAEDKRRQKDLEADLELQDRRDKAQARHAAEIAAIELQLRLIREQTADKQTDLERARALEQKKRDLEAAKLLAQSVLAADESPKKPASNSKGAIPKQPPSVANQGTSAHPNPERKRERSESEKEWERQKRVEGASDDAIDLLMALTGLESVKEKFLDIKAKIETVKRQGIDMKKERMGMVMLGNPGTGKFKKRLQTFPLTNQQERQRLLESTRSFWHLLVFYREKSLWRLQVLGLQMRVFRVQKS
jgi:hypothetical protein